MWKYLAIFSNVFIMKKTITDTIKLPFENRSTLHLRTLNIFMLIWVFASQSITPGNIIKKQKYILVLLGFFLCFHQIWYFLQICYDVRHPRTTVVFYAICSLPSFVPDFCDTLARLCADKIGTSSSFSNWLSVVQVVHATKTPINYFKCGNKNDVKTKYFIKNVASFSPTCTS